MCFTSALSVSRQNHKHKNPKMWIPDKKLMTLEYVFEMNRHGARAPTRYDPNFEAGFGPDMVTSMGLRQRYLLGKYNWQKY